MCAKLNNMTDLIQRKCEKFVDQLIGDEWTFYKFNFLSLVGMHFVVCNFDLCSLCVCVFLLLYF